MEGVFAFQTLIVASLIVVRIAKPAALTMTALGWSAFTLVMVFMPWLMTVQLVVIWGAWAALEGGADKSLEDKASKKSETLPEPGQANMKKLADPDVKDAQVAPSLKVSKTAQLSKDEPRYEPPEEGRRQSKSPLFLEGADGQPQEKSFLQSLNEGLESLSNSIDDAGKRAQHQTMLMKSTREIRRQISREQSRIKSSLNLAEKQAYIDRKCARDPSFGRIYKQYEAEALKDDPVPTPKPSIGSIVNEYMFGRLSISAETDGDLKDVHREALRVLDAHQDFLESIALRVEEDKYLREHFYESMTLSGGQDVLTTMFTLLKVREGLAKRSSQPQSSRGDDASPKSRLAKGGVAPSANHHTDEAIGSRVSSALSEEIEARRIPYLVHFTQAKNLFSIQRYGIIPIDIAEQRGIPVLANDPDRLDGRRDATCLSIGFPNVSMFWKYRKAEAGRDWCVIVLNTSILTQKSCLFCKRNAASKKMRDLFRIHGVAPRFQSMFEDVEGLPKRSELGLPDYFPTDDQAEVLVKGVIEPSYIKAVAFESQAAVDRHASFPRGMDVIIHPYETGFFARNRATTAPEIASLTF